MAYEKYTKVSAGTALLELADLQDYLNVDDADDNDLINGLITGWTNWTEEYCWCNFNETTWTLKMEEWQRVLSIKKNPIKSITSITYRDSSNAEQTLSSSTYKVYDDVPGRIEFESMPSLYDRVDAITINFTTEYTEAIPTVKMGIKSLIALQFLQREDFKPDGPYISMAKRIFAPYRLNYF